MGRQLLAWGMILQIILLSGCNFRLWDGPNERPNNYGFSTHGMQIDYPDVERQIDPRITQSLGPRTLDQKAPTDFWELTLEECVQIALANSKVIRDLGGRVLSSPDAVPTIFEPGLRETDPLFGPEGALSAFDAQWTTNLFWSKNDRAANNIITGGGIREIIQDLGSIETQLQKTTALGTQLSIRNLTQYDQGNQPGNLFTSGWDTQWEMSVTQPLLRGAGTTINRIAGPNAAPGSTGTTGVLLARLNTDITLVDFELSVMNFISDLEDAYWDLYFSYRDLDAKTLARDSAKETYDATYAKFVQDKSGGEADKEAQAKEQYYFFQDLVQDALNGAATGGSSVGVYRGERRLRLMMGLPANDGRLIRPQDEPSTAKAMFSWDETRNEALLRRPELRRQMWQVKRRQLELIAARNFALPQLDLVALYRLRGFGDHLTGDGLTRSTSAMQDVTSGDHQEWQLGIQWQVPIGYRQELAAIKQAEMQLAREHAVLRQQELEISHGLSDAIAELIRAHASVRASYNRLNAAAQRNKATEIAFDAGKEEVRFEQVLLAQQRLADSQTRYFQGLAQYAKAVKNVHLQKGSVLEYNGISLTEGPWSDKAYADANELRRRLQPVPFDYRLRYGSTVSAGAYSQQGAEPTGSLTAPHLETLPTPRPDIPTASYYEEPWNALKSAQEAKAKEATAHEASSRRGGE